MLAVILNTLSVTAKPGALLRPPHRLQLWQIIIAAMEQTKQHQKAIVFAGAVLLLTR